MPTIWGRSIKIITPEEENSFSFYDDPADLKPRPPVVTVMGHVDHGKTSLLDAIRNTHVIDREAGGITQHIGASQVEINGRQITFVDTPGHEAFTAMRAATLDRVFVVILVVAADDGVMPQTVEAINHSKAAGVPIVVAVNKCDKPDANPDRVRQELTEYGVIPEEWGGENMFVNVSAKKHQGIEELLESVLLQADVLELKANPDTFASGYILEAKLDRGRGPVATVLVNRGTLHVGDALVAGLSYGRVRAMIGQHGEHKTEAGPSDAVEVLGLSSVPAAGDEFRVFDDERDANTRSRVRRRARPQGPHRGAEQGQARDARDALLRDERQRPQGAQPGGQGRRPGLHRGAGRCAGQDGSVRGAHQHHPLGGGRHHRDRRDARRLLQRHRHRLGVRPQGKARDLAEREKVQIKTYSIIYKAIEDIDAARIGMLKPTEEERQTGAAEVRETFRVPKVGVVAGCMVTEGELHRNDKVRVVRDGVVIYDGTFASMRRFKDDVTSVKNGYECGLGLDKFQDIKPGDVLEGYEIVQIARTE